MGTLPFAVGIYHGFNKPHNPNVYLSQFVSDMELIIENGISFKNKICQVRIKCIVCDAPARAYITCTIGHDGYFSCTKCIQQGVWLNHVVLSEVDAAIRTNESFEEKYQEEHHTGISILEDLGIGMVSQVASDYMHIVCLGVFKKMITLLCKGPKKLRLKADQLEQIDQMAFKCRKYAVSEFARLPRPITKSKHFKATEFHQYLFYLLPVLCKDFFTYELYVYLLSLSIGIKILCDEELCVQYNTYANDLLVDFVETYKNLYGKNQLNYNLHNLIHLAKEV